MTDLYHIERFLMFVLEGLCAVCAVAAFWALLLGDPWWAILFAACSWGSYESACELDQC